MPSVTGPSPARRPPRPLPPAANLVDRELCRIDRTIDWLTAMSPLDSDRLWEDFVRSRHTEEPILVYRPLAIEPESLRSELDELPLHEVEDSLLEALLAEKQRELVLFTYLLELRDTQGALATSIELFGGTEPRMLRLARRILQQTPRLLGEEDDTGCETIERRAQEMFSAYRELCPDFSARVVVEPDLNSHLMVHGNTLFVARSVRVPKSRVTPLLAHEVGTHIVTYYNGTHQGLRQLAVGLASYDELQEGLAALAEYLAGYLPVRRLRTLAARVVGANLVAERRSLRQIFHVLHHDYGLMARDAFEVAVRSCRGGGLTKDAVYLRGLFDLLEYLRDGGRLDRLYSGKFSLSQVRLLDELEEEGWVVPPRVLPFHISGPCAESRLAEAIAADVADLYHRTPEAA